MSSPRGHANHRLYLARLVLAAWQRECATEQVPAQTLAQAFGPACHDHLLQSYGWFLLAIARPDDAAARVPQCVAELPELPAGKALAGEIREFEQLEQSGWLAELLGWQTSQAATGGRLPGNLASPAVDVTGPEAFETWSRALDDLFQRMGDSLDEY